jgi:hypothetical protein
MKTTTNIETYECEGFCGEKYKKEELSPMYDIYGEKTHEAVCERCKETIESEAEPMATVVFSENPDVALQITDYRDDTEGEFKVNWYSTSAWRGYFKVTSDNWALMQSDCSLWGSYDSSQLEEFDQKFRELLDSKGIRWARVISRTSNVFSAGYDFFVEKDRADEATLYKVFLAVKYRDQERFDKTALTGADPADWDDHDDRFYKAYELLKQGMTPEEAVKKVMGAE